MTMAVHPHCASAGHSESTGYPGTVEPSLLSGSILRMLPHGIAVGGWRSDLMSHRALWGPLPSPRDRQDIVEAMRSIELTGRGGGHFPAAIKLQAAMDSGPGGTVVVNAAEGEPASAKDSVLWQFRPHMILDGASVIADAIGAREIVVWLHVGADGTRVSVEQAIAERLAIGADRSSIRILLAPDSYVSGESSAVIAGVRGQPVAPTFVSHAARPWGEGPAILVHNTETVARIGMLSHTGVCGYPDTSMITVARPIVPGREYERVVIEVPSTATVADALRSAGVSDAHSILLGGFAGTWHRIEEARDLPLDPRLLRSHGLSLGAGILIALSGSASVMDEATEIADYLAESSAGQCGPCVFGLPALARSMRLRRRDQAQEWAELVEGRGGCRMPDGAVRMIRSAMALDHQWALAREANPAQRKGAGL